MGGGKNTRKADTGYEIQDDLAIESAFKYVYSCQYLVS